MSHERAEGNQFALLGERRFGPFFLVQFFGAFTSNLVKNALVIFVTYQGAYFAAGSPWLAGIESGVIVNLAAGLFVLPFILFSATAGQIADKYEKSSLIRLVKVFEIGVMVLAAWGFVAGHLGLLLAALFLCGAQSSLFGPVKYSLLPQVLREAELVGGNALVESGTFVAILLGTIAGGVLASLSGKRPGSRRRGRGRPRARRLCRELLHSPPARGGSRAQDRLESRRARPGGTTAT